LEVDVEARRVEVVEEACVLWNVCTFVRRRRPCPLFGHHVENGTNDGHGKVAYGASLGLLCGSTSLFMPTRQWQAVYLGISNMVVTFGVVFLSGTITVRKKKILQSKGYATIICLLTFSIALVPFYGGGDRKWYRAVMRILNVLIGCAIGACGSVVFWPRSTVTTLFEKLQTQVNLAGDSSLAVLHAAGDLFHSDKLNPLGLADELLETSPRRRKQHRMSITPLDRLSVNRGAIKEGGDNVLAKFGAAMADWRAAKLLFPLLAWDPFKAGADDEDVERFKLKSARILAQSLRIQTLSMVLDGIIREDTAMRFETKQVDLFVSVGTLIQQMLNAPMGDEGAKVAATKIATKLSHVRGFIRDAASAVTQGETCDVFECVFQGTESERVLDKGGAESTTNGYDCAGSVSSILLFLELVETLILRSLRLYHTWVKAEKEAKIAFPTLLKKS
jgi:hypothetical protein